MITSRHILLAFGMVFSALAMRAEVVSEARARRMAEQFLSQRKGQPLEVRRAENDREMRRVKGTNKDAAYYIFNESQGEGFVVLSGDDRLPAVVGYSENGSIHEATMPPAMMAYLNHLSAYVEALRDGRTDAPPILYADKGILYADKGNLYADKGNLYADKNILYADKGNALPAECAPLVKSEWGQRAPFNNLVDGVTGCVAVVLSQIMYTHRWPDTGTGAGTLTHADGTTMLIDFDSHTYQWDKMHATIDAYQDDQEAQAAAAVLFRDVCAAVSTQLGEDSSGAYDLDALKALIQNFRYKASTLQFVKKDYMRVEDWVYTMKNEVASGRPVYYSAQEPGRGGHAFVVDGYDSDSRLHINWGWDGRSNGYFHITFFAAEDYNFIADHSAIIGIEPDRDGDASPYQVRPFFEEKTVVDAESVTYTSDTSESFAASLPVIKNLSHQSAFWNFGLGLYSEAGQFLTPVEVAVMRVEVGSMRYMPVIIANCIIPIGYAPGHYTLRTYVKEGDKLVDGYWYGGDEEINNRVPIQITADKVLFNIPLAITSLRPDARVNTTYSLDGRQLSTPWESLGRGLYIHDNKKILKTR